MILETKSKTINLVLKTRKIVDIANKLKNKKFEDAFFEAMRDCDIEALSKIIFSLAEVDVGKAFNNSEEVYDFLDDYKTENNKTYTDIYEDIAKAINEEGFFKKKMTEEELQAQVDDIMSSVNLESIIKNASEKAVTQAMEKEFVGFKG